MGEAILIILLIIITITLIIIAKLVASIERKCGVGTPQPSRNPGSGDDGTGGPGGNQY